MTVWPAPGNPRRWAGRLTYRDSGCAALATAGVEPIATSGRLETTYYVEAGELPLARAVAAVARELAANAEQMGIELRNPALMVENDGDDPDHPFPPGWKRILADAAAELGWEWPCAANSGSYERS
ncbi:MAG: hypothetical protein J2P44_06160 [Candidatus Dormibacteraeota bacterium]|nr:hypothetical protein [Candidatus Dormibacteraeota bacterium]